MSRIFLLRHAHSTANEKGILAGRMPKVALSKEGLKQREELSFRLIGASFDQVISSPITRCIETIKPIFESPTLIEEFQEVDYGDWTGKKMSSLYRNKSWRDIHRHPGSVRFPNGETLPEVQTRALRGLDTYLHPKSKNVLISTHADVVKVLILHALGTHINNIDKISIDNASFSIIEKNGNEYRVLKVNDTSSKLSNLLK
jgi:broad specificity phosphatase PhoE